MSKVTVKSILKDIIQSIHVNDIDTFTASLESLIQICGYINSSDFLTNKTRDGYKAIPLIIEYARTEMFQILKENQCLLKFNAHLISFTQPTMKNCTSDEFGEFIVQHADFFTSNIFKKTSSYNGNLSGWYLSKIKKFVAPKLILDLAKNASPLSNDLEILYPYFFDEITSEDYLNDVLATFNTNLSDFIAITSTDSSYIKKLYSLFYNENKLDRFIQATLISNYQDFAIEYIELGNELPDYSSQLSPETTLRLAKAFLAVQRFREASSLINSYFENFPNQEFFLHCKNAYFIRDHQLLFTLLLLHKVYLPHQEFSPADIVDVMKMSKDIYDDDGQLTINKILICYATIDPNMCEFVISQNIADHCPKNIRYWADTLTLNTSFIALYHHNGTKLTVNTESFIRLLSRDLPPQFPEVQVYDASSIAQWRNSINIDNSYISSKPHYIDAIVLIMLSKFSLHDVCSIIRKDLILKALLKFVSPMDALSAIGKKKSSYARDYILKRL